MELEKNYMKDKDFVVDGEITVTITLGEYRSLIEFMGKYEPEISNLNREVWKLKNENSKLREKIANFMCEDDDRDADE